MAWTLINSWAYSSLIPNVDFNGLAGWSDIRVLLRGVTLAGSGQRAIRVSTDNGASFLSTSGDYVFIDSAGAETLDSKINAHATASAAARSGEVEICGFNLAGFKVAQCLSRTDFRSVVIPVTTALTSVRIYDGTGASNLSGGAIHVYGR